jgi:hypothetical protein
MKDPEIIMVHPIHITPLWEQVKELIAPALLIAMTHSVEDVRKSLMAGNSQLWIQWRENKVEAAVVTEFKNYPQGLWFNFWLAGAIEKADIWWSKFLEILVDFAILNKCKGIEDCGRAGWDWYCPSEIKRIGVLRRMILKGN